jgi:hypothetical protein
MRPRTELAIGAALLVALGIAAVALGTRRARVTDVDPRRSTYLSGPSGARGLADAAERLGVTVIRYRRPVESLDAAAGPESTLVAVIGPSIALTSREGARLAADSADLLLAGRRAEWAMRCLGYRVAARAPSEITSPVPEGEHRFFEVRADLVRDRAAVVTDSSDLADGRVVTCTVPAARSVDTLLTAAGDRAVALRLTYESGRRVTLVADDRLFTNRSLRETGAGPFVLGLVVPRYSRLVVDELHHGYEGGGSLAGATLSWSLRSPWGWAAWQAALVGLVGLLAAGIRFGPVRTAIERRRRSPLEHVRALATALAAARGHDVAVRLMIQGLRRRLSASGRPNRGDLDAWLGGLAASLRTERGREALADLTQLTRRQPSADEVLRAANEVETLWEELKPR